MTMLKNNGSAIFEEATYFGFIPTDTSQQPFVRLNQTSFQNLVEAFFMQLCKDRAIEVTDLLGHPLIK